MMNDCGFPLPLGTKLNDSKIGLEQHLQCERPPPSWKLNLQAYFWYQELPSRLMPTKACLLLRKTYSWEFATFLIVFKCVIVYYIISVMIHIRGLCAHRFLLFTFCAVLSASLLFTVGKSSVLSSTCTEYSALYISSGKQTQTYKHVYYNANARLWRQPIAFV